ncbi:5-formyltetrahydrofolate cyclo-ligase [Coralloluteibacterium thermophilus]|uniref:5-formyltetrahydrofolate cyclo-ligase n=1 Tax=Coralloluteibacterium thermophilum TaxID=2707049 RepID=A0ABV9NJV0_9GAMM
MDQTPQPAPSERDALRRRLRSARAALPALARIEAAQAVAERLQAHPALQQPGYVAGYWAVAGELPLHAVLGLLPAGAVYCLPRLHPEGRLVFAPWRFGDSVTPNRFGIPEPDLELASCLEATELHAVLVPLVGFDRRGNRLGTGGGWYDRTFAFRQESGAPPWLVGVGFAEQEIAAVPAEAWDVRLDAVVTERELILPA